MKRVDPIYNIYRALRKAIEEGNEERVMDALSALQNASFTTRSSTRELNITGMLHKAQKNYKENAALSILIKNVLNKAKLESKCGNGNAESSSVGAQSVERNSKTKASKLSKSEPNLMFKVSFDSNILYVPFYSKSSNLDARKLSNFYHGTDSISIIFTDGSRHYPTGEHAFQAAKFVLNAICISEYNLERSKELMDYSKLFECGTSQESSSSSSSSATAAVCTLTASDAKRAGKKFRLNQSEMSYWHSQTESIQVQICRAKLRTVSGLEEYLRSTENQYLLHHEALSRWSLYGGVILTPERSPFSDGRRWLKGSNLLGLTWMNIRDNLQTT